MTSISTALVWASPAGVGPFNDTDLWRIGRTASLIEGSTNGPFYLFDAGQENEHVFMLDGLDQETVLAASVMTIAVLTQFEPALNILRATENLVQTSTGEKIAPYWDLDSRVFYQLIGELARVTKIGVARLEEQSLISPTAVELLRSLNLDVREFEQRR